VNRYKKCVELQGDCWKIIAYGFYVHLTFFVVSKMILPLLFDLPT
jgi:hypothetical protein